MTYDINPTPAARSVLHVSINKNNPSNITVRRARGLLSWHYYEMLIYSRNNFVGLDKCPNGAHLISTLAIFWYYWTWLLSTIFEDTRHCRGQKYPPRSYAVSCTTSESETIFVEQPCDDDPLQKFTFLLLWPMFHPATKFHGNRVDSFYAQTKKQTTPWTDHILKHGTYGCNLASVSACWSHGERRQDRERFTLSCFWVTVQAEVEIYLKHEP